MKSYFKKTTFFIGLVVCLTGCGVSGTVSNETEPEELSVTLNEDWQEDQSEKEKEYQELLKISMSRSIHTMPAHCRHCCFSRQKKQ